MIMTDVYGAEIPVFIDEEVHHVESMQGGTDKNRRGNITVELILICDEREVTVNNILVTLKTEMRRYE